MVVEVLYLRTKSDFHPGEFGEPVPPTSLGVQDVSLANVYDALKHLVDNQPFPDQSKKACGVDLTREISNGLGEDINNVNIKVLDDSGENEREQC